MSDESGDLGAPKRKLVRLDPREIPGIVSVRTDYCHKIETSDLISEEDLEDLLREMHDFAEHRFEYYFAVGSEFNKFIRAAQQRGAIVIGELEFEFYKHPKAPEGRLYIRIREGPDGYFNDWEREVAENGPAYLRTLLSLSERERRKRDIADLARKPSDPSPVIFKPTIYGMGFDGPATMKWFTSTRIGRWLKGAFSRL